MSNKHNPSRFYSIALGKWDNFKAATDGLIVESDSSPSVALHSLLYSNNTTNSVSITMFDDPSEGQVVHLYNIGSSLFFSGASMKTVNSSGLYANDNISFRHHNGYWYEETRCLSSGNGDVKSTTSAADWAPDVSNARVLLITATSAKTLKGLSGGYAGQVITLANVGSNTVTVSTGDCFVFTGTNAYLLTGSNACQFVCRSSTQWYGIRGEFGM